MWHKWFIRWKKRKFLIEDEFSTHNIRRSIPSVVFNINWSCLIVAADRCWCLTLVIRTVLQSQYKLITLSMADIVYNVRLPESMLISK